MAIGCAHQNRVGASAEIAGQHADGDANDPAMSVASTPTAREIWPPYINARENIPADFVGLSQWFADGGLKRSKQIGRIGSMPSMR